MATLNEAYDSLMKIAAEARNLGTTHKDALEFLANIVEAHAQTIKDVALLRTAVYQILHDCGGSYEFDKEKFDTFLHELDVSEGKYFTDHPLYMFPEGEIMKIWLEDKK